MNILRLLFLFFVGLFVRRLFKRPSKNGPKTSGKASSFGSGPEKPGSTKNAESLRDITEQEIDDADFEEIP